MAGQLEVADRGRPISGIGRPHLLSENRNRKARDLNGLACSSLTTSIRSDQLSARFQIWTGVFFRANDAEEGGASVPRSIAQWVTTGCQSVDISRGRKKPDITRKASPVQYPSATSLLPMSLRLGGWPAADTINSRRSLAGGIRSGYVPIDCLQCSLGHGRRSRAFYWAR
jgi:hypothetical protein